MSIRSVVFIDIQDITVACLKFKGLAPILWDDWNENLILSLHDLYEELFDLWKLV